MAAQVLLITDKMTWKLTRKTDKSRTWYNDKTGEQFSLGGSISLRQAAENAASKGRLQEANLIKSIMEEGFI